MSTHEDPIKPEHPQTMSEIAGILAQCFPGFGFALLVFDVNAPDGFMNYISNARCEDMCLALSVFIERSRSQGLM